MQPPQRGGSPCSRDLAAGPGAPYLNLCFRLRCCLSFRLVGGRPTTFVAEAGQGMCLTLHLPVLLVPAASWWGGGKAGRPFPSADSSLTGLACFASSPLLTHIGTTHLGLRDRTSIAAVSLSHESLTPEGGQSWAGGIPVFSSRHMGWDWGSF